MSEAIKNIIIVGGGAAGWLAASHLGKTLNAATNDQISITLIESALIPPIGVGEGTVPGIRDTLKYFGIKETEFFRRCDASFKQSIKFVDWNGRVSANGEDSYHHIFDTAVTGLGTANTSAYWQMNCASQNASYVDAVSIQGALCDANLAPKTITTPEYLGQTAYAYHLDAGKFSEILKENAIESLGIKHLVDEVEEVVISDTGDIEAIVTLGQGKISADFFIDCTGFKSLLLGKALKVPFVDKSDILFADHALATPIPYEDENTAIPPYTISTAVEAGWIWDIALPSRRGVGHVYSSKYMDHDKAEEVLRSYLGDAGKNIEPRLIPMKVGYQEQFWYKNCVAIGLSSGFVEPLEATGLLVFDASSRLLADCFPSSRAHMDIVSKSYNKAMKYAWDRVIDFVKLHYYLSERRDTQFWIDNTDPESAPRELLEKLEHWRHTPPTKSDFFSQFEIFELDSYLYILNGMNFKTNMDGISGRYPLKDTASKQFSQVQNIAARTLSEMPFQRELIAKIKKYGLQKV